MSAMSSTAVTANRRTPRPVPAKRWRIARAGCRDDLAGGVGRGRRRRVGRATKTRRTGLASAQRPVVPCASGCRRIARSGGRVASPPPSTTGERCGWLAASSNRPSGPRLKASIDATRVGGEFGHRAIARDLATRSVWPKTGCRVTTMAPSGVTVMLPGTPLQRGDDVERRSGVVVGRCGQHGEADQDESRVRWPIGVTAGSPTLGLPGGSRAGWLVVSGILRSGSPPIGAQNR